MKQRVEEGELRVPAIKNGSVIDHIPMAQMEQVISLLELFQSPNPITIGLNFKSRKLGSKGLIKVEDKFFTPEEVNKLALVCPDVVINVIRDYEVAEKIRVRLEGELRGLVRCPNPKCITNNEPMTGSFTVVRNNPVTLRCNYCTRKIHQDEIELTR